MIWLILAAAIDPRLATIAKVYVQPVDQLEDDRPVAACVVEHLPRTLPLTIVERAEDADVVLKVAARVSGQTARTYGAIIGGAASVSLGQVGMSAWIDGKQVWKDSTSVGAGSRAVKRTAEEDFCSLADAAIEDLRKAIRKARDGK